MFDFGSLNENLELFSNKNEKVVGKNKIETPKNIWIDEFIALGSKPYSFKCKDKNANKINGISKSQSKIFKFGE